MNEGGTAQRAWVLQSLRSYWPQASDLIEALPIPVRGAPARESLPPRLVEITLPQWAGDVAPEGRLPVPAWSAGAGAGFAEVDWIGAACWYLNGTAERAYEAAHGPIHSYAYRLSGWPTRMWERAWVNRIAMLLRRWAAREAGSTESTLFGALPRGEIVLTHDVDAVRKSWSTRVKQSAFHVFNGARRMLAGDLRGATARMGSALRFAFSGADYWRLDEVAALDRKAGMSATFMLYGRSPPRRSGRLRLLDPDYDVLDPDVAGRLACVQREGHAIGLHPSFAAWRDPTEIREERERVERACGMTVTACRQHWLRFSWRYTWAAQHAAGLSLDMTLGFNDRPGFRNGAALRHAPWDERSESPLGLEMVPLVLMDSQVYDYAEMDGADRARAIAHWIGEVTAVGGRASVIWHPHTLAPDYGWRDGLDVLLDALRGARR